MTQWCGNVVVLLLVTNVYYCVCGNVCVILCVTNDNRMW
jgi:hypothetical protein